MVIITMIPDVLNLPCRCFCCCGFFSSTMKTSICPPTTACNNLGVFEMNHAFNHAVWINRACCGPVRRSLPSPAPDMRCTSNPSSRSSQRAGRADRAAFTCRPHVVGFGRIFTPRAIFDHQADGLFNPDPMIFLRDDRGGLIDPSMLVRMHSSCNLILTLRIGNNLFIFEH